MHETTADVQRDIAETRARISQTLSELEADVSGRKAAVRERVDAVRDRASAVRDGATGAVARAQSVVTDLAREHPWGALVAAIGIGIVLARTGADAAAVHGVVGAAKGLGTATASGARSGVTAVKGLVSRGGGSETVASGAGVHAYTHDPATGAIGSSAEDTGELEEPSVMYRLSEGLIEAVLSDELIEEMRREAGRIGRA